MSEKETIVYEKAPIRVYWKAELCEHAARCILGAPEVFNPDRRPWIKLGDESAKKVARVIDQCPTRALSYDLIDKASGQDFE